LCTRPTPQVHVSVSRLREVGRGNRTSLQLDVPPGAARVISERASALLGVPGTPPGPPPAAATASPTYSLEHTGYLAECPCAADRAWGGPHRPARTCPLCTPVWTVAVCKRCQRSPHAAPPTDFATEAAGATGAEGRPSGGGDEAAAAVSRRHATADAPRWQRGQGGAHREHLAACAAVAPAPRFSQHVAHSTVALLPPRRARAPAPQRQPAGARVRPPAAVCPSPFLRRERACVCFTIDEHTEWIVVDVERMGLG